MNKAIFLDRDGTINKEKNYLYKIEDFEFIPKAIDGLKILSSMGYKLFIITNQSGIGRGYYTENDYLKLEKWLVETLKKSGVLITKVYHCPHIDIDDCSCRKPKIGLFNEAIKEFEIDLSHSYAIGDMLRDLSICSTTPCKGFLVGNKENKESISAVKKDAYEHISYKNNLYECAKEIMLENQKCSAESNHAYR